MLKIADFGFAAPTEGRDGKGFLTTKLGTRGYMAPELYTKQPYDGARVDVFSAGVILFCMLSGHPPFTEAIAADPFYKSLVGGRADIFWKYHSKSKPNGEAFYSEEFRDLVASMLALKPTERPSINTILDHPWMKQDIASNEEVL